MMRLEGLREQETRARIDELAGWAREEGDLDVQLICRRALDGEVAASEDALVWWAEWARSRRS